MGRFIRNFQLVLLGVLITIAQNAFAGGSIAGKVTIVKGQVFIMRGSQKILAIKDISVLESDVIESQSGGTARITMIDSNLVDVYPKSKVEIAKYVYKPNKNQKDVELKVDFGKIKSTVNQKYDGASNKFQVKTPSAVAGVRGTVFTAEYDASKKVSRVITIEGLVAVTKMLDRERQTPPVFVRPDQVVKVDAEQASQEKPRNLTADERDLSKKEDKDLGYQYDPKKEPTPAADGDNSSLKPDIKPEKIEGRAVIEPVREAEVTTAGGEDTERNSVTAKNSSPQLGAGAPALNTAREFQDAGAEVQGKKQKQLEEEQGKKQKQLEEEQGKKQKQLEEEQGKKQKQLEEEQGKKQKQLEEEQGKKQKQLEEEQGKKQKQLEEEQGKKQKQLEEEQGKKQKQLEEEQGKKQKQLEEEQAKKQKQLEEEQNKRQNRLEEELRKREEEIKRRTEEEAERKAEYARRQAEIAKNADAINRPPSGTISNPAGTPHD